MRKKIENFIYLRNEENKIVVIQPLEDGEKVISVCSRMGDDITVVLNINNPHYEEIVRNVIALFKEEFINQ